jgi:plasmid stability protein
VLTEGSGRAELQHGVAGDEDRRRGRAALMEEGDAEVIKPSGLRGSVRGTPVEVARELKRSETHRRRGIARAENLPLADQRRWRLRIRATAHGAEARDVLGEAAATWDRPERHLWIRRGARQPRRAGRPCNGPRASRGSVTARPNPSARKLLEEGEGVGEAGQRARGTAERGHGQ